MESDSPESHLVLGILNTELAKTKADTNALAKAKHLFQSFGQSSTECDTIPGRQCMASYFYMMEQWDDCNCYLDSIKDYLQDDDVQNHVFFWNLGISLAACGKFKGALSALLNDVSRDSFKTDLSFVLWLAKSYII
mmetsp:Transcript_32243/g.55025  ORF Transcript_32243/g.55025 Transcript_32243/m.55025 type:complete len:136 (-) Transcript_32243:454-861(-)